MSVIHTGSFGQLWPISWTITHCFGVLEWFPWLTNPVVHLCVGRQHSQFWPILTRMLDYYSLFWGPEEISIVVEAQGAITCRSSRLAVLADSGPFHGLLLAVSGPGGISTIDEPQGALTCRTSTLAILADSCPFHGLLLAVLGSRSDFHD